MKGPNWFIANSAASTWYFEPAYGTIETIKRIYADTISAESTAWVGEMNAELERRLIEAFGDAGMVW